MEDKERKVQEELEKRLNLLLLDIVVLQDKIWDGLEALYDQERLSPEVEGHVRQVMGDVSFWVDQCTAPSKSPPILLRRMEVHLARLERVEELIEKLNCG